MKPTLVPALLGLSALLLWVDRLAFLPEGRSPALAPFAETAQELWPTDELRSVPFEGNPLVPENHVHLLAKAPEYEDQLFSVYHGHYPLLTDAGDSKPHDPALCYRVSGYEIVQAPELVRFAHEGRTLAVQRIVVGGRNSDGSRYEFTTYYWSQFAGRMPEANADLPGSMTRTQLRYTQRRADLVWVRVEFTGPQRPLDAELQGRLVRLMRSVQTVMADG